MAGAPDDGGIQSNPNRLEEDSVAAGRPGPEMRPRDVAARQRIVDILASPRRHRSVFQPILSLTDGKVVGYEGLSRFPAQPVRSPDRWFREATRVGLGPEFQAAAIGRITDAATSGGLPEGAFLSVNVSPRYLAHPAVVAAVTAANPSSLVIEITEEETVEDYAALRRAMAPYLDMGIRFAVDDAGAGFASMRHVIELGPAYVKLDAYLVRGMRSRQALQAFLRAINSFTLEIGAILIAEGVEHVTDLAILTETGFSLLAQGYAIARPGPPWARVSGAANRAWLAASGRSPVARPAVARPVSLASQDPGGAPRSVPDQPRRRTGDPKTTRVV